jgi:hypothetical protein
MPQPILPSRGRPPRSDGSDGRPALASGEWCVSPLSATCFTVGSRLARTHAHTHKMTVSIRCSWWQVIAGTSDAGAEDPQRDVSLLMTQRSVATNLGQGPVGPAPAVSRRVGMAATRGT